MNRGLFGAQVNICWDIINSLELEYDRVWIPLYKNYGSSDFIGLTYLESWEKCLRNQLYDFQLTDNSLIQFRVDSFSPLKVSYSYYECPYQCLTYAEFVASEMNLDINIVRDGLSKEYGDYLNECEIKDTVTPFRYDFDPDSYGEGRHPASHIHFGHGSNIRISTRKVLKPLSFLLLVIRQVYPVYWMVLLEDSNFPVWCSNIRVNLTDVHSAYWNPKDQFEVTLH